MENVLLNKTTLRIQGDFAESSANKVLLKIGLHKVYEGKKEFN